MSESAPTVYRFTTHGEGTWTAGRRLLPPELVEEANQNRQWLTKPTLPEGNYRSWFTEEGKSMYVQTLLTIHRLYLSNIEMSEKLRSNLGDIAYEDAYQILEIIQPEE